MSNSVLSTWGVVLELDGDGDDARIDEVASAERRAASWFETARHAYFDRCPRLAAYLRAQKATLVISAERIERPAADPRAGPVLVGVSVTEIRPSSFEMACRIRWVAHEAMPATNGRCSVAILRASTSEPVPVPREVRDELIAIQLGATSYC